MIEIGATDAEYEHCLNGKCNAAWLCAGDGAPNELKKILEHSREGLDNYYGKHGTNSLAQAFNHSEPKYKTPNVKLLLEYGANPKEKVYKNLTPLLLIIANFL